MYALYYVYLHCPHDRMTISSNIYYNWSVVYVRTVLQLLVVVITRAECSVTGQISMNLLQSTMALERHTPSHGTNDMTSSPAENDN